MTIWLRSPAGALLLALGAALLVLSGQPARADIVLSPQILNDALKEMQRLKGQLEEVPAEEDPEPLFRLGQEADELALVFTNETIMYGRAQQKLIKLGLDRAGELGVNIRWFPAKERFIYDGAAFERYLELAPEGEHAGEAAFQLLQIQFYESSGNDRESLHAAVDSKQAFLARFPDHERAPEAALMLAIDYRDLWRLARETGSSDDAHGLFERTRQQYQQVMDRYAGTRAARNAAGLLERLNQEYQSTTASGSGDA